MTTADAQELEAQLRKEAERIALSVRPLVLPTGWPVGPVTVYLFEDGPATLIDAGVDNEEARRVLGNALSQGGRSIKDLGRIIVTHGHNDHIGGAAWLQEASGCEVFVHREDARPIPGGWGALLPKFTVLGLSREVLEEQFGGGRGRWEIPLPTITELSGGERFAAGGADLKIEHHSGHSPGHLWVIEKDTGAVFAGDFLLAGSPTVAGVVPDPDHPTGLRPMLEEYEEGLRELSERGAPVIFPSHGPPVTDPRVLIERRLQRSDERTEAVTTELRLSEEVTPFDLTMRIHGQRIQQMEFGLFQFLTEVFGRLEMLVERGKAGRLRGEAGVWYYRAVT